MLTTLPTPTSLQNLLGIMAGDNGILTREPRHPVVWFSYLLLLEKSFSCDCCCVWLRMSEALLTCTQYKAFSTTPIVRPVWHKVCLLMTTNGNTCWKTEFLCKPVGNCSNYSSPLFRVLTPPDLLTSGSCSKSIFAMICVAPFPFVASMTFLKNRFLIMVSMFFKSMDTVRLLNPCEDWSSLLSTNRHSHQFVYNRAEQSLLLDDALPRLNKEQLCAFTSILHTMLSHVPQMFSLQGAAGTGKTFVYKTLCYATHSQDLHALCVASSRIAALLLPGGRTTHSTLKIPLTLDNTSTCAISRRSFLATTLKDVHLLIWDKCSMQNRLAFEAVNWLLQDICANDLLFGGVTTILGGDFLQTLPIVSFPSKSDTLDAALFSSPLWPFHSTTLSQTGEKHACQK
jgi:hypothetical protein